jgi:hypothetical protein
VAAVIREEKFLISKRPYAVRLDSLRARWHESAGAAGGGFWDCRIDAVWFRRRRGETVACSGELWDYQDVEPADGRAFLEAHTDGRYGGTTEARWDGSGLWSNGLDLVNERFCLNILRPMLANFPAVPPEHDGWWRFETTKERQAS